jgi:hypothetical protein
MDASPCGVDKGEGGWSPRCSVKLLQKRYEMRMINIDKAMNFMATLCVGYVAALCVWAVVIFGGA